MDSFQIHDKAYQIIRLLGHGKGGYSYLTIHDNQKYVVKKIHHEPCSYYQFGNKIEAEKHDYQRLLAIGIPLPKMIDIDEQQEVIVKEYIDGKTIDEIILNHEMQESYLQEVKEMQRVCRENHLNIDWYPTNFVVKDNHLFYVDYECNSYMDEWSFESWGYQYWTMSDAFKKAFMKSSPYEMETERLYFRKFSLDDAEAMYQHWASDPEVTKYMTWNPHENVSVTRTIISEWVEGYQKGETDRFAIVLKSTNEVIGAIDVVGFHENFPEIGYVLSRKYWNQGMMTEACKAMVNHLFQKGYRMIYIEAHVNNIGSNRVIQKVGFQYTHQETKPLSYFKPEIIIVNWYQYKNPDFDKKD